ncbi:MAG: hypothetical protein WDW38_008077 [Sanguina aurantia]
MDVHTISLEDAEQQGRPRLLSGLISDWPACKLWSGAEGIQHLVALAGEAAVQVMVSPDAVFCGDVARHEPLNCRLRDVLERSSDASDCSTSAPSQHLYLAQAELTGGLEPLHQDFACPAWLTDSGCLPEVTNMWLCTRGSCSSLHYDPYHNLLAVTTGSKTVTLYSPSLTPFLYPMSISGDSPNHSCVNCKEPDFETHPGFRYAQSQAVHVHLKAGDCLFIPEGWWHQVDSTGLTIAINFWWTSPLSGGLQRLASTPEHTTAVESELLKPVGTATATAPPPPLPDLIYTHSSNTRAAGPEVQSAQQQQQQHQQQGTEQQRLSRSPSDSGSSGMFALRMLMRTEIEEMTHRLLGSVQAHPLIQWDASSLTPKVRDV